jgi:hypothetical protein
MTGTSPSPIEGGLILPEFEKGVYAGVLDVARPKGGEIAMLFGLARVYQALGLKKKRWTIFAERCQKPSIIQLIKRSFHTSHMLI